MCGVVGLVGKVGYGIVSVHLIKCLGIAGLCILLNEAAQANRHAGMGWYIDLESEAIWGLVSLDRRDPTEPGPREVWTIFSV